MSLFIIAGCPCGKPACTSVIAYGPALTLYATEGSTAASIERLRAIIEAIEAMPPAPTPTAPENLQ